MKRIVVFLLVIALTLPALFSCDQFGAGSDFDDVVSNVNKAEVPPVQLVSNMYKVSQPTKVVASEKIVIVSGGVLELNGSYEIVTGYVDNAPASIFKSKIDEIRSVEDGGSSDEVKPIVNTVERVVEAIEGVGSRVNGGQWNEEGQVWTIGRGRMGINLKEELLENVTYENHTLTFDISEENVAAVLGEEYATYISGTTHVVIVDDGAVVLSIEINYNTAENAEVNVTSNSVYVKIDYTYDFERININ